MSIALDRRALVAARRLPGLLSRADLTINELPALGSVLPTDVIPIYRAGQTYQVPASLVGAVNIATAGLGVYNIVNYGAVPGADSTTAIADAYNAAVAAGGGIVFVPAGTFYYSSALVDAAGGLTARNVMFLGTGFGSILKQAGIGVADFSFYYGTAVSGIVFQDLQFVGNNVVNTLVTTQPLAIHCENSQYIYINRCKFTLAQGFGDVYINNSTDIWVTNNVFDTSGQGRLTAKFMPMLNLGAGGGISQRVHILSNYFFMAHFHSIWLQAVGSEVIGNNFETCGEARVVNAGGNTNAIGNIISDNVDDNGWMASVSGQFIESFSDNMTAVNNRVANAGQTYDPFSTGNTNCIGIYSAGGNAVIANNSIVGCKSGGIAIAATNLAGPSTGQNVSVTGNVIVGNGSLSGTTGGISSSGGGTFGSLTVANNTVSGNLPFDIQLGGATFTPTTTSVRGNSAWPDTIGVTPTNLGGSTALTQTATVPIPANSMMAVGGFRATTAGKITTTVGAGTASLYEFFGGHATIVLGGAWANGDTITYTLNGHATVYTVVGALTSAQAATALAAAIAADGTTGPLVTPAATSIGTVTITAKTAAYALLAQVTQAIAKVSATGTATQNGTSFIIPLAAYTSAANISLPFSLETLISNSNSFNFAFNSKIIVGTAITYDLSTAALMDTTINQDLTFYGQLSAATDSTVFNQLRYERL